MREKYLAKKLNINGVVQGVGFRPFIFGLAKKTGLNGYVINTSSGVTIHIEGKKECIETFHEALYLDLPPISMITDIQMEDAIVEHLETFLIKESSCQDARSALISPDVSVCEECVREMMDPNDRRFLYPFINCTNCGPRYTIIDEIPYDRPNTSMKSFNMCDSCCSEYDSPDDRRFHAQPNACPDCGPALILCDHEGNVINNINPAEEAVSLLKSGNIVAIKGLGGFHLAVDAMNIEAVKQLRMRKNREEKPFALMAGSIERITEYVHIDMEEKKLLESVQRPVVLLKKIHDKNEKKYIWMDMVAPRNNYLGFMLPYMPLHHIVFNHENFVLVMTSGNRSDEPIAIDNRKAFETLFDIADYFLINNRDIYQRNDDSILKRTAGDTRLLRRGRGFTPAPVFLKNAFPHVLGCGAEIKNTICLIKDNKAFLSQHIGDIGSQTAYESYGAIIDHLQKILDINPSVIAHDFHPDYASTHYAQQHACQIKVPVQHHHAHIVSCMAENMLDGYVIGIALDGSGYGSDGAIWGGEVFIACDTGYKRAAHMKYVPMPGGNNAVLEPWRMAVSYLYNAYGNDFLNLDLPFLKSKAIEDKIVFLTKMINNKINTPLTSSMGRLFDGIAGIMGLREKISYEGQAAMELESLAMIKNAGHYNYEWYVCKDGTYNVNPDSIIKGVVGDIVSDVSRYCISSRFHYTLVNMFSDLCDILRKDTGLDRIVLSGGSFQNTVLLEGLTEILTKRNFRVYSNKLVPCNDGGISLGQAVIAGSTLEGNITG